KMLCAEKWSARRLLPQKPAQTPATRCMTPRSRRVGRFFHRVCAPNSTETWAVSRASANQENRACLQHRFINLTTTGIREVGNTVPKTRPDGRHRTAGTPIRASGRDFQDEFLR